MVEKRTLGRTGCKVSVLGMGCSRIASFPRVFSRRQATGLLRAAYDAGISFYDTADTYSIGASERLIGNAFAGFRDDIFIATKAGLPAGFGRKLARKAYSVTGAFKDSSELARAFQNFQPMYIRSAIDASLKRLASDYIDLFMLHSPWPEVLLDDGLVQVLETARQAGKVRYLGVSCREQENAIECLKHQWIDAIQIELNLVRQSAIDTILPAAAKKGIGVIARQPFGGGAISDWSVRGKGRPSHQIALQFVMHISGITTVVAGMSHRASLDANISTLALPPLSDETFNALRRVA